MNTEAAKVVLAFCCLIAGLQNVSGQLKYPVSKKTDHEDDCFNTKVNAPYKWLSMIQPLIYSNGYKQGKILQKTICRKFFSNRG